MRDINLAWNSCSQRMREKVDNLRLTIKYLVKSSSGSTIISADFSLRISRYQWLFQCRGFAPFSSQERHLNGTTRWRAPTPWPVPRSWDRLPQTSGPCGRAVAFPWGAGTGFCPLPCWGPANPAPAWTRWWYGGSTPYAHLFRWAADIPQMA